MLDTLALGFEVHLENSLFSDPTWKATRGPGLSGGILHKYEHDDCTPDGAPIHTTYFPCGYNGMPWLLVSFSLPRLVFGSNVYMVDNIAAAIEEANRQISVLPWCSSLDLRYGKIVRVDLCWNHQVGDRVQDYIGAFGSLTYPHRDTILYASEGVMFRSKQALTKFYDKSKESHDPQADGILRQESSFRGKTIKQVTGKVRSTPVDLTDLNILAALNRDLERLRLNDATTGSRVSASSTLVSLYGHQKGMYLYGILGHLMLYPDRGELIKVMGISRQALFKSIAAIRKAGLTLSLSKDQPLPPLSIPSQLDPPQPSSRLTKYPVILINPGLYGSVRKCLSPRKLWNTKKGAIHGHTAQTTHCR